MRIQFSLAWHKGGTAIDKAFKSRAAAELFDEYRGRISRFVPCDVKGLLLHEKKASRMVWVCEREKGSKQLSSEALAQELQKCMSAGSSELQIVIGGPDGFTTEELERMRPNLRWSFGSLTFPHELAAVMASEQIYRALTILGHLPYHRSHS